MASPAAVLQVFVNANTKVASAQLAAFDRQLTGVGKTSAATGASMGKMTKGAAMAGAGIAAVGAVAVVAGKQLYDLGVEFDEAYDTIRVRTGATGRELEKLQGSFRDVAKNVPNDFEDVGKAVGDLNTRLGLTGKPLERMAENMLHLSNITGDDLESSIRAVAVAFNDFQIPLGRQEKALNGLFRLYQASGVSVAQLAESVQKFGSPLRQLGFSFGEAASMFAAFERAGVNTQTMMPGLRMAIRNLTQPSADLAARMQDLGIQAGKPEKALQGVLKLLGNSSNLSVVEKTGLAYEVFGTRAGADMAEAIKQGRFEVDKYLKIFRDNKGDSIKKAADESYDFSENVKILGNNLKLFLEPAANAVFVALDDVTRALRQAFRELDGTSKKSSTLGNVLKVVSVIVYAARTAFQLFFRTTRRIIEGMVQIIKGFAQAFKGSFQFVMGLLTGNWRKALNGAKNFAKGTFKAIVGVIKSVTAPVRSVFQGVVEIVRDKFKSAYNAAVNFINGIIKVINKIPGVDISTISLGSGEGSSQRGRAAGLQRGGALMGGKPSGDSIPAMLERGEYVLNREAVKKIGVQRLNQLNFKNAPRFQKGGRVGMITGGDVVDAAKASVGLGKKALDLVAQGPGAFIDLLPKANLPQPIQGLGPWLIKQVSGFIKNKVGNLLASASGGVPGYTGPPPDFKQLGNNSWVDSNTLAVGYYLANKFGVSITDGWRPQNASYGAINSSHKRGTPGNPGALDFAPPSTALQSFAAKHIAGLTENDIHDWGTGLHNHIAFFQRGGIAKFNKGGFVGNINKIWGEHNSGYGDWGGPTLPSYVVAALAQAAGMPGKTMEQVTRGESGAHAKGTARPGATGIDPGGTKGHGLWMITSGYNEDLAAKVGGWGKMLNPVINAWAASQIYRRQGLGAWYGTGSVTGNGINYSGNYDIANALGGLGYRGALYMATDGGLGEKPKSIEALRKGAAKALDRVRALRGRGAKGFLDAAVGNAREASKLAGEGEVTRAKSRLQKARAQIRKAVRAGKKPGRPGGGGGGAAGGAATPTEIAETVSLEQNRAIIAQLDEKISLFERSAGAEWSPAGGDYDQTEIDGLRALYVQLRDAYVLQRDLVEAEIRRVEEMIQRRKEKIGEIVQKIRQWQIDIGVLQDSIRGGISEEQAKKWRERIGELEDKLKKGGTANQKEAWREEIKNLRGKLSGPSEEDKKRWKKQIEKIRGFISSGQTNMGNHNTFIEDARSIIEDNLRPELEDLIGVTGESGKIGDTNWEILALDNMTPGSVTSPSDGDSEIADLLRQQLQETQRALAISQAQMPIFQQFMPRFHQGGVVQGPMGAERPVMAQAGEGIFTRDQMRAMGSQNITVVIEDAAIDSNRIRVEVDGVIQDKVSTVRRQGSNRKFVTSR